MTESQPPPPTPPGAPPSEDASAAFGYRVELPTFEGPLDLLLHLIEEHELDIRDIPIAFVAKKYVEYITLMDSLNIDVASEYLVMAATLAHIKSKSLLPTPPADDEEDEEDALDPRAELIRRLLEYQKYKHAGEALAGHDVLGRDVFPRGMPAPSVDGPAPITGLSLFKLLDAFQSVLSRAKATIDHQIDFERFSITDRINELSDILRVRPRLSFEELFEDQESRAQLIVTFLALLEMTRLRLTRLYQDGPLELIFIELSVSDEEPSAGDPAKAEDDDDARAEQSDSGDSDDEDSDDEDSDDEDSDDEDSDDEDEDSDEEDSDEEDSDAEDSDEEDSDEEDEDDQDDEAEDANEAGDAARADETADSDETESAHTDKALEPEPKGDPETSEPSEESSDEDDGVPPDAER